MNFRLPFQISRVSAICQSSSPVNLISKFTPIYGNHVKYPKQEKQHIAHQSRIIIHSCTHRTFHSPFNIYQQKAFIHDIADTEQAVKERVRAQQCCDYQIPEEPKLAFRQSSKIECCQCVDYKPCVAPPLIRPPKIYDDSKCQYQHECYPDLCNISPPRMDDLCCLRMERKKLPSMAPLVCCPCMDNSKKPMIAPPLCPPQKLYDPNKLKWDHGVCNEPKSIRMDDACEFKVEQKELPRIPRNNCKPCLAFRPLTAPNLTRPVLRYNPICIPYPHPECPCDAEPPRRDHCCCEPICRELPPIPCSNCLPCQSYTPTKCPVLNRPKARYDALEMKYKHHCPQSPCDTPSLRRDNKIISVTLTKKKLPPITGSKTCKPCIEYRPLTAPELRPPKLHNDNMREEQSRLHCVQEKCARRDGKIKIYRKCLPPVPISNCMKPCMDIFTPCTTPNFMKPNKLYDDSTCQYRHVCDPDCCSLNPPRMDDIKCYKVLRKLLPKPPNSPDCKPCIPFPKKAPRLCRPKKKYDDTTQKYRHVDCPIDPCKVTKRSDDITGIKDKVKSLQTYKPLKCKPCQHYVPCTAPPLCRPRARYDDSCMLYDHTNCPPPCDEVIFRRDHYLWEEPKKLSTINCGTICDQCQSPYPSSAPPLNRPTKLYEYLHDPVRVKDCPPECPPRMDDLLCWKPKRKKLPSFKDCNQCCCYSTLSWSNKKNMKCPINCKSDIEKTIYPKIKSDFTRSLSAHPVSNLTKLQKNKKICQSKIALKEKSNDERKHATQRTIKPTGVESKSQYYVAEIPTWKSIDVSEVPSQNKTNHQKKYDYSIEKWLKEGAEQIVHSKSKSSSFKRNREHIYNQFDFHSKYSVGSESITPVRFTGFDTSSHNEYLCVKKNNKLQPLRIGSTFRSNRNIQTIDNTSCNKPQIKSTICLSRPIKCNTNNIKIMPESVPKVLNKHFTFSTIIQEHIKQQIIPPSGMPTSNFVLKLSNKMRSSLFQKMSNFFKQRENVARDRKILNAPKNKPETIFERNNDSSTLSKELMANVCEKYNTHLDSNELKMERNKPYVVQKFKNHHQFTLEMKKPTMCSSKLESKTKETNKTRSLPKNVKMKIDRVRNFSTQSKGSELFYKHIDISDDYIGKIYKVKLKKIGVKNLMLEKNDPDKRDEEPHTICYICKVVPRYQPVIQDDLPDLENVKINYYKEKRNTIE